MPQSFVCIVCLYFFTHALSCYLSLWLYLSGVARGLVTSPGHKDWLEPEAKITEPRCKSATRISVVMLLVILPFRACFLHTFGIQCSEHKPLRPGVFGFGHRRRERPGSLSCTPSNPPAHSPVLPRWHRGKGSPLGRKGKEGPGTGRAFRIVRVTSCTDRPQVGLVQPWKWIFDFQNKTQGKHFFNSWFLCSISLEFLTTERTFGHEGPCQGFCLWSSSTRKRTDTIVGKPSKPEPAPKARR